MALKPILSNFSYYYCFSAFRSFMDYLDEGGEVEANYDNERITANT